jgi:uncharacterized membrane protein YedE/YeeE
MALAITLLALAAVAGVSMLVQRRRTPPPAAAPPTTRGAIRLLRGSWPLWVGEVVLAGLNALVLLTRGSAWGITSAFALWGAKAAQMVGMHPQNWTYWQSPDNAAALHHGILTDGTTLTDLGIIVGALVASAVAGSFMLHRRVPWRLAVGAVLGGMLMGFGARLAHGCNIGAYLAGIASFSLHGWVWAAMAVLGTWLGLKTRRILGLTNPKPTDTTC